jgi:hypothetical protein
MLKGNDLTRYLNSLYSSKMSETDILAEKKLSKNEQISIGWDKVLNRALANEIYERCWDQNRGNKFYKKLAKEYKVGEYQVIGIAQGDYTTLSIHPSDHEARIKEWEDKYGFCVEVRSPGNDLLEFYDEQNLLRGESQRNYIPPSVIHQIRFSKEYLSTKDIYAIAKPYYDNNPTTDADWSFYKMLRKERLKWLVDKPSIRKVCYSQEEVNEYVRSQTGAKTVDYTLHKEGGLGWHGKLAGWSFIKKKTI